jgi:hypothetical protein
MTAMHKDTSHRYGSVEAVIRDIDHYLADEPLEPGPTPSATGRESSSCATGGRRSPARWS